MKRMKRMKRMISLLFAAALLAVNACLLFTGCRKVPGAELKAYEGWWKRPEEYQSAENSVLSDTVEIKAAEGSLTCYGKYGFASDKYSCALEDEQLAVFIDAVGKIRFILKDNSLVNAESGKVEYVRGEPAEQIDISVFFGRWYKNGDKGSDYYEIKSDGYDFYFSELKRVPRHSGSWDTADSVRTTADGKSYDEMLIKLFNATDINNFRPSYEYSVLFGGIVLRDSTQSSEFYVRETAIDSGEADEAIAKMMLASEEWTGEGEEAPYISFEIYSSNLLYNMPNKNDAGITVYTSTAVGKWNVSGGKLFIEFTDGSKESFDFDAKITSVKLAKYNMNFTRDIW